MGTTLKRTTIYWGALWLLALAVSAMALVATTGTARAQDVATGPDVTPTPIGNNATCKDLLGDENAFEIKIDPPKSGTYGPITVTFRENGAVVDFESTVPVLSVFVKGGRGGGGNYYDYSPDGSTGDTNLIPNSQQSQQISHVSFCWTKEPTPPADALMVSKTAKATYDNNIKWELTKDVDPASHTGNAGETAGTSKWTVTATKKETPGNYEVTGVITVTNPNDEDVDFSVTDTLDDGTPATVDCDAATGNQASGIVPANDSVECTYSASPPSMENVHSNNVQVSSTKVPGDTYLADVVWEKNDIGDTSVTLEGEILGFPPEVITDSKTLTKDETFDCPGDPALYKEGSYSYKKDNTATLTGDNTNLKAEKSVDVDCKLPALTAKKTAKGTYDRTITWDLSKTVTPQSAFSGVAGDSFNYTWNVGATKKVVEDNYKVTGEITIYNPSAISQKFSVTDELDKPAGTMASVDCNTDLAGDQDSAIVPAKNTYVCSYTASTATATLNTATVKAAGNNDVVATAPVSYTANPKGDESVTLGDTSPDDNPPISFSQMITGDTTKTFSKTFTCPTDPTKYTNYVFYKKIKNTATLTGPNTSKSAEKTVEFTCKYPWRAETATGAGTRYPGTSNWFMYTAYQTTKVGLIAGQKPGAGDIVMTRPGDGNTYITVTLANGFRFANVQQNLKIQPFASAPKSYVQPGAFQYKFSVPQSTSTYKAKIPGITAKFYGIHADVERYVP